MNNSLYCPKCLKAFEPTAFRATKRALPPRASCPHCGRDLHTCENCEYYAPGRPNSCKIPGTEPIAYRDRNNFCDQFLLLVKLSSSTQKPSISDIERDLFNP